MGDLCARCREIVLPKPGTQWSYNFGESNTTRLVLGTECSLCKLIGTQLWLNLEDLDASKDIRMITIELSTRQNEPNKLYCQIINNVTESKTAAVALSVSYFPPEPILNRPWHLEDAKHDLTTCVEDHSDSCGSTGDFPSLPYLPTRLLGVGKHGSDQARLIISSKEHISDYRYAALSYCWGTSTPFTTKKSTQDSRLQGFSLFEMPLTLREAVQVTRDLGLPYLWIDALCILQRSQDDVAVGAAFQPSMLVAKEDNDAAQVDWQLESTRMDKVYGQAFLTIVAAGASDKNGGLFHGIISCVMPYEGKGSDSMASRQTAIISLNLNEAGSRDLQFHHQSIFSRGWALQEWVLSARLLVFTMSKMYYVCNRPPSIRYKHLLFRFASSKVITNKSWYNIVQNFCSRNLTEPKDKLPALSGLAKRFSELSNGEFSEYRAGLWKNTVHLDMLWHRVEAGQGFATYYPVPEKKGRPCHRDRARAPSWSWAAIDGPIIFRSDVSIPARRILCETKTVKGGDVFGQVESGTLVVHCPFKMASITKEYHILCEKKSIPGFWADDPAEAAHLSNTHNNGEEGNVYCLGLGGSNHYWMGIVVRSDQETSHFLRIGFFVTTVTDFEGAEEREFIII